MSFQLRIPVRTTQQRFLQSIHVTSRVQVPLALMFQVYLQEPTPVLKAVEQQDVRYSLFNDG